MNTNMNNQTKALRRTFFAAALAGAVTLGAFVTNAADAAGPGVSITTGGSVRQTVSQLKKLVSRNGMMVMGELHQGKVLSMTGINVKSETLFVGNPQIGKQLFSADPGVGAVVPVRINVYQDANGKTVVRYIPPSEELDHFQNPEVTQIGRMLDQKLKDMTSMLGQ